MKAGHGFRLGPLFLLAILCQATPAGAVNTCGGENTSNCACGVSNFCICDGTCGNCVWHAWHMACCDWGEALEWCTDATTWDTYAQNNGYPTGSDPEDRSIFVCNASSSCSGWGHVGWVVTAYPDGSFDSTEQYWGGPCGTYDKHRPAGFATGGFIYDPNGGDECGDGRCTGGETNASCPVDCPVCESIPPGGRIVDETDICFQKGGDAKYWNTEKAGWLDTLLWTHTIDKTSRNNYGVWQLELDQPGTYRLEAFVPSPWGQSTLAGYQVRHDGVTDTKVIDQSMANGWVNLGDFGFAAGADQWVQLADNTGEPYDDRVQIVFDAIRVTPAQGLGDGGPSDDGGASGDADPTAGDALDGDADQGGGRVNGNCHATRPNGAVPLALTVALLLRWRRRRTTSAHH